MRPLRFRAFVATVAFCLVGAAAARAADWTTPAERARFRTTPSYDETKAWLQRLVAAAPAQLSLQRFGVSPEGRDLMLVVAAKDGEFTPQAARASGREIVLVQSGIHAGEIEGKDAALMLLRDMTVGAKHADLLDHAIVVWLPIFNVDGHEHRGAFNRINQDGPAETGFRGTAQYLNLNRDYMKADAPEMRAWLALFDAWLPDLFMDIHTTDGADYQYDLTWYREDWGPLHPAVEAWQRAAFDDSILPAFEKKGHLAAPYLELVDHRDITRGITNFGSGARFSTGYVALRNRAALLVETHMLKPYATRVHATYDLVVATLAHLGAHPGELRRAVTQADADTVARSARGESTLPVAFATAPQSVPFELRGYAFTQEASSISGDTWTRYDRSRKKTYAVPYFRDRIATASVAPPAAYLIPAAWPGIAAKLREHGLRVERLPRPLRITVERYQLDAPHWDAQPFEGRHRLHDFSQRSERVVADIGEGAYLVALDQPAANVAVTLLEPAATDSLLQWGFFDAVFEQKEGVEARVGEQLARDMLAKDPALKAQFEQRLAEDAALAQSPERRLAFFYDRSPWHAAQRVGAYPVVRLDAEAVAAARRR